MGEQKPRWIDDAQFSWTPPEPWGGPGKKKTAPARPAAQPDPKPQFTAPPSADPLPHFSASPSHTRARVAEPLQSRIARQAPPPLAANTDRAPGSFFWRLVIGLTQGLALAGLFQSRDAGLWPGGDPYLCTALTLALVFAPLLLQQGQERIAAMPLLAWTALAGAGLAALGFYHRWRVADAEPGHAGLALAALIVLFLFISQTLILACARAGSANPRYRLYFDCGWQLAVQLFLAASITGICWALMGAGYGWFRTHDPAIQPGLLTMPVVAVAAALAIQLTGGGLARGGALALTFVLRLMLPLAILAGVLATAAALANYRAPGLATSLGLGVLVLVCLNASYDGSDMPRPVWRRRCEFLAAFVLLSLVILGSLALAARVAEYGWSTERIFAVALLMALAGYALCYAAVALISLGGGLWMERLEKANLLMAFVVLAMIAALASPFADPARLAVAAQRYRIESGKVTPAAVDFAWLHTEGLRFGGSALDAMTQDKADPALARGAFRALAAPPQVQRPMPSEIGANITVRTPGARLPDSLLARDWRTGGAAVPPCLTSMALGCDAYFMDLDGDGHSEILLTYGNDAAWWAGVMKQGLGGGWYVAGTLAAPPCPGALSALRAGDYRPVPRVTTWRDLMVAGQRLVISLTGGTPPVCPS